MENRKQLKELSIDFAINVSDVCDKLSGCTVYKNQLIRSSSSIGANIHEAKYAQSRADFISKLEISLKETSESEYWLELIHRKHKISDNIHQKLMNDCGLIRRMLIASVTTAKKNANKSNDYHYDLNYSVQEDCPEFNW